jgi:hypothetical protein
MLRTIISQWTGNAPVRFWFLLLGLTILTASVSAQELRITFPAGSADLRPDYRDNARAFAMLDSLVERHGASLVDSVIVVTKSSPEGRFGLNASLAERRSRSVLRYLSDRYPAVADRVSLRPEGEAWDEFRLQVLADTTVSALSRERALSIIDSGLAPDLKERLLHQLPEYGHYLRDFFPEIRLAIILVFDRLTVILQTVDLGEVETAGEMPLPMSLGPVALRPDVLHVPALHPYRPLFAVSTNLLYDLGGLVRPMSWTPNVSLEIPFGQRWSLYAEYDFPWWISSGNDRAWQVLKWDLGARWWFSRHDASDPMDVLRGHFLGLDLGAGYYDIEPQHTGYQGEFQLVGLEYGYAFRLAERWRLDVNVGAGWMATHYRHYAGTADDAHLLYQNSGRLRWVGPVKAGVSLKYIFTRKNRRGGR